MSRLLLQRYFETETTYSIRTEWYPIDEKTKWPSTPPTTFNLALVSQLLWNVLKGVEMQSWPTKKLPSLSHSITPVRRKPPVRGQVHFAHQKKRCKQKRTKPQLRAKGRLPKPISMQNGKRKEPYCKKKNAGPAHTSLLTPHSSARVPNQSFMIHKKAGFGGPRWYASTKSFV